MDILWKMILMILAKYKLLIKYWNSKLENSNNWFLKNWKKREPGRRDSGISVWIKLIIWSYKICKISQNKFKNLKISKKRTYPLNWNSWYNKWFVKSISLCIVMSVKIMNKIRKIIRLLISKSLFNWSRMNKQKLRLEMKKLRKKPQNASYILRKYCQVTVQVKLLTLMRKALCFNILMKLWLQ